jgi:hypothetical protein
MGRLGEDVCLIGDSDMSTLQGGFQETAATERNVSGGKIQLRDVDITLAEAELRLGLAEIIIARENIEKARVVSQETLEFKFSI